WKTVQAELGAGNNEPVGMQEVMNVFATSTVPAYIVFITDGGVARAGTIKKILIEASYLPIFWQFVGVRGSGYGILQDLDSLDKRYVDNADFFALDDFKTVPNEELYSRLLNEFPAWLKSIKINGVLDGSAKRQRSSERDLDHLVGYFFRL
ncbi:MAG: VWA domain-containing protein, partial [Selenomonadaceae bacterium]|nr:VWA domain-containing protein [Selenomonadaceae bacterium]